METEAVTKGGPGGCDIRSVSKKVTQGGIKWGKEEMWSREKTSLSTQLENIIYNILFSWDAVSRIFQAWWPLEGPAENFSPEVVTMATSTLAGIKQGPYLLSTGLSPCLQSHVSDSDTAVGGIAALRGDLTHATQPLLGPQRPPTWALQEKWRR